MNYYSKYNKKGTSLALLAYVILFATTIALTIKMLVTSETELKISFSILLLIALIIKLIIVVRFELRIVTKCYLFAREVDEDVLLYIGLPIFIIMSIIFILLSPLDDQFESYMNVLFLVMMSMPFIINPRKGYYLVTNEEIIYKPTEEKNKKSVLIAEIEFIEETNKGFSIVNTEKSLSIEFENVKLVDRDEFVKEFRELFTSKITIL